MVSMTCFRLCNSFQCIQLAKVWPLISASDMPERAIVRLWIWTLHIVPRGIVAPSCIVGAKHLCATCLTVMVAYTVPWKIRFFDLCWMKRKSAALNCGIRLMCCEMLSLWDTEHKLRQWFSQMTCSIQTPLCMHQLGTLRASVLCECRAVSLKEDCLKDVAKRGQKEECLRRLWTWGTHWPV